MNLPQQLILLKGEPRTLQIAAIEKLGTQSWHIRFKGGVKWYTYNEDAIVWLRNPKQFSPDKYTAHKDGQQLCGVTEILQFKHNDRIWWRIRYKNDYEEEYNDRQISVITNILSEAKTKGLFYYFYDVAKANILGKENGETGILAKLYEKTSFISTDSAAACYLNPDANHIKKKIYPNGLIFPFGCNISQSQAVKAAFEHQISIIQGPPGTGKTQTILNIIANIVRTDKTTLVVSNNNSAIYNILEKLQKDNIGFIVAPLGKRDNKETFIGNQPNLPDELLSWPMTRREQSLKKDNLNKELFKLNKVYELQSDLAKLREEQQMVDLEWRHFRKETNNAESLQSERKVKSNFLIHLWFQCQQILNEESRIGNKRMVKKLILMAKKCSILISCKYKLRIKVKYSKDVFSSLITKLQTMYYPNRLSEIKFSINKKEAELKTYNAAELTGLMTEASRSLLRCTLYEKYKNGRQHFTTLQDCHSNEFLEQYPVVLSTTFSARTCLFGGNKLYDYVIMDEASQVSIETGALALTCARNAVIVGDTMQLPNVITKEDKETLNAIKLRYDIADIYDCSKNSFLKSVCSVISDAPHTLLREHYRCHPRIINFCNQKFYGGNLLIMTQDNGETDVMSVIKTNKGNHAADHYNQREIDVIREEALPNISDSDSIGIVTPYNNQVEECRRQLPKVDVGTIHKYQGREKDVIIMSVVDNRITPFSDDANLLNVAVSRAKKQFRLVVTGNEQKTHGNITDLIDYIAYNNFSVTKSKITSIFDYLYEQYSRERVAFLQSHIEISEYASENFTFALINEILKTEEDFMCYKTLCHIPLREIIRDMTMLSDEEKAYTLNYSTHLDFLIVSRVSKKPVLAIETDGYSFHNAKTVQHKRDEMKDRILRRYSFPLLRLSTKGSNEKERITNKLRAVAIR